jgi:hypothetical protein
VRRFIAPLIALLVALTFALPQGHVMAATQSFTFSRNVHVPAGTTTFGGTTGFNVPAGNLNATIDTAGEPNGISFSVEIDNTLDGGTTWVGESAIEFTSDPATNKQGQQTTQHNIGFVWPGGGLRVVVTASAPATLTVSGSLTT